MQQSLLPNDDAFMLCLRECTDALAVISHAWQSRVLLCLSGPSLLYMVNMSLAASHALCFKMVCLLCCQTQQKGEARARIRLEQLKNKFVLLRDTKF